FYSSVRIDVRRIATIKNSAGQATGNRVRARIVKNKVAAPFKTAEFDLMFDGGISREGDLLDLGIECEIIQKSGAWLNYGKMRLGQGKENAKNLLIENKELANELEQKVLAANGMTKE
ncbi:MAG: DNA recombination/repair protein RecA, partial [Planctomycetes bacterium]|nr:DNA recombination/repair protein RecA [Planctomycetota bacterium]